MNEPVLSEGEIRAIWHEDPATMDRATLRQVAHYITRPPTSWDPDTFHRPVRQEPEEVLATIEKMRARLQAYAADLEQEAVRLKPTLRPGLTAEQIRSLTSELWQEGKGDFIGYGLNLRHADLAEVAGRVAFRSAVVEVEGVGFYEDRYLKKRKEDGFLYPEITTANTPEGDYIGRVIKDCLVTCLSCGGEAPEEQAAPHTSDRPEFEHAHQPDAVRNVRVISLLDPMHMRTGAYERLKLDPVVNYLREEDGSLSALSDTWVILLFQSLCADGIIPADGVPGRDFVLLNEAEHARDIAPLLDALEADERAVLLKEYDQSGALVQARFLLAEDAERIRQAVKEKFSKDLGTDEHHFLNSEGEVRYRDQVTEENESEYAYVDWCPCHRCMETFHEEALEPIAENRMREESVALLEPNGEGTCPALDALQYFLRPEQNQTVIHLVAAEKGLADQQQWVAKMVGLLTEHYYRLSYTTPGDISPRGVKNAATVIGYELATVFVHELDNVRKQVEEDFFAAQLKYGRPPSPKARAEARRRQAADLAAGVFYPKGGPPTRSAEGPKPTPRASHRAAVLSRPAAKGGRVDRKQRQVNGG